MKILALECSAGPASVAIVEDNKVIGSSFINVKLTHSQTLLPMVSDLLKASRLDIGDIEGVAIAAGPGSFTGIRIGISVAKGIAAAKKLPCVPVSTLGAMAEMFRGQVGIICAVMDARCNQLYNAIFEVNGDTVNRLCEDRALMCDELKEEIKALASNGKPVIVCGDGADLFLKHTEDIDNVFPAPQHLKFQNAVGVAMCGARAILNGDSVSPEKLLPVYLRLPQAERELKEKKGAKE